jgi:hypothetical protein
MRCIIVNELFYVIERIYDLNSKTSSLILPPLSLDALVCNQSLKRDVERQQPYGTVRQSFVSDVYIVYITHSVDRYSI